MCVVQNMVKEGKQSAQLGGKRGVADALRGDKQISAVNEQELVLFPTRSASRR